ncbi:hypothetical protein SAMN06295885_2382 [Rathayibacter oskolensis]|uniref:Uncharacterized protein n=1 Tax=Rathayibacter oskolensis TaxID=1891671 RepID=A0A1X7P2Z4_9MICO|nr:hypothetical protein [Rathayibacter oskolensis]SMH44539.1 hypothetical protein SAMN06295885_2382 [Rathayibacter oskolensis]
MPETTETDPRYHAAYQRGYEGPAPERLTRAEERFRRPRRGEPGREMRGEPRAEIPVLRDRRAVRSEPAPALVPPTDEVEVTLALPAPTLGRRVPITLAIIGAVLVPFGSIALWWATNSEFGYTTYVDGVDPEQYLRLVLQYTSTPALTVGLLSLSAAVVAQALRAQRP